MIGEVAVGDGDCGGPLDGINHPINTLGHRDMIDPNILRPKDGYPVPIAHGSEPKMIN